MSEKLTTADYPLAEKRPELVAGRSGKPLADHPRRGARRRGDPRRPADHAGDAARRRRSPGRRPPDARRQFRAGRRAGRGAAGLHHAGLRTAPARPRQDKGRCFGRAGAPRDIRRARIAAFVEEAAEVYERRGLFTYRFWSAVLMNWKTDYRSIYYLGAPEPPDIELKREETALLVIDVQNTYRERPDRATLPAEERRRYDLWTPFHARLEGKVIPNTARSARPLPRRRHRVRLRPHRQPHRATGATARSATQARLEQPAPAQGRLASQIVPELAPVGDEIVVTKMTDSALTGTNLRLLLHQHGDQERGLRRRLHRSVRFVDGPQPRRRELQRDRGRGLLRGRVGRTPSQGARDHQLIYCNVMSSIELKRRDSRARSCTGPVKFASFRQEARRRRWTLGSATRHGRRASDWAVFRPPNAAGQRQARNWGERECDGNNGISIGAVSCSSRRPSRRRLPRAGSAGRRPRLGSSRKGTEHPAAGRATTRPRCSIPSAPRRARRSRPSRSPTTRR